MQKNSEQQQQTIYKADRWIHEQDERIRCYMRATIGVEYCNMQSIDTTAASAPATMHTIRKATYYTSGEARRFVPPKRQHHVSDARDY